MPIPSPGRYVLLAIAVLLALVATAEAAPRGPLSHEGRWITDAKGRVVILHGWNMVYKVGSYRPEDTGFGPNDMRFLKRHGFNTIRLGIIQNGVEPNLPGKNGKPKYRDPYLDSIAKTESQLSEHGIFTMLDVHQDMYNERFQGEGFPDWAVVGEAATLPAEPQNGFPLNYLQMPALNRAFDYFWQNAEDAAGRPLQDSFAAMWTEITERFEGRRNVFGYNILNEPWPGTPYPNCVSPTGCPALDASLLQPFTEKVIEAIREVDQRNLIWYAPWLVFDFGADTSLADTGDENAGFAFNMYCLGEAIPPGGGEAECDTGYDLTLANAEAQTEETGDALLMTEYAATQDVATIARVTELADEAMIGWQQWHYCDCDDPTTTGTGVQSLVSDPSKPPKGKNLSREKLEISSRPYPRAVAGTPLAYEFNPETREFTMTYSVRGPDGKKLPRKVRTEIFMPPVHYRDGYSVTAEGARSHAGKRLIRLKRLRGASEVTVEVTPE
ncbi:MAG TPA: cellulase family glycosylhydrolase [Solirubrobacterales bacterium]|nr:cellulase family glycosylhydrolase [Solirubrobacterales bacterium]